MRQFRYSLYTLVGFARVDPEVHSNIHVLNEPSGRMLLDSLNGIYSLLTRKRYRKDSYRGC